MQITEQEPRTKNQEPRAKNKDKGTKNKDKGQFSANLKFSAFFRI